MRFNSKNYEERRVVLDGKEKELLDKCSDLIEGLMEDFSEMNLGVTLSSPDCGDFYEYTGYEWYCTLLETYTLLSNLLMANSIVGRDEVKEK